MNVVSPVGIVQRGSTRRGLSAIVAVGAAFMLVSPVAAQSPSPSTIPAASVAPVASVAPSAGATTASPLVAMEAAFAAQACDPFLTAAELSATAGVTVTGVSGGHVAPDSDRPGFIALDCVWSVDGGTVSLKVAEREWTGKGKPKAKDLQDSNDRGYTPEQTKLAGPGDAAFSDPGSERGYYPGRPNVTWSQWLKHGKKYADRWVGVVSDVLDVAALETLAAAVRSDATPGDAPIAVAPGDAAAPLVGSWTLSGWSGQDPAFGEPPAMTATFDDAGTATTRYDCKDINTGKKLRPLTALYFVDGNNIAVLDLQGQDPLCQDADYPGPNVAQQFIASGFERITSASDATWTVDGDTLTITGVNGEQPYTWTFTRAAD